MGSRWRTPLATKKNSGTGNEMKEMSRWAGSHAGAVPMRPPPLPRYVDSKMANMMLPSPAANVRSPPLTTTIQQKGPPVPPKEIHFLASPMNNCDIQEHRKGIRVQTEWDVERGISEENGRQPLDPRRIYDARW